MASPIDRRTTLRAALTGGLGVAALTGCTDAADPAGTSSPRVEGDTATRRGSLAPDDALVDELRVELAALTDALDQVARRHRSQRDAIAPLRRLHKRQVDALGGLGDTPGSPALPPMGDARAARLVEQREKQWQRRLRGAAIRCESGDLASLLATMAAGVAQHRAEL